MKDGCIAIVNEVQYSKEIICDILKEDLSLDFYKEPCNSKLLGISFFPSLTDGAKRSCVSQQDDFRQKACCLPYKNGHLVVLALHGVEW